MWFRIKLRIRAWLRVYLGIDEVAANAEEDIRKLWGKVEKVEYESEHRANSLRGDIAYLNTIIRTLLSDFTVAADIGGHPKEPTVVVIMKKDNNKGNIVKFYDFRGNDLTSVYNFLQNFDKNRVIVDAPRYFPNDFF